jgi:phosphoglucosamine mutase
MTKKLFGTDGVRGTANIEPMTADYALRLGMAAGHYFTRGSHRHTVVIGKDTRLSGYMLEPALTAGFVSMGMDVILLGPLPTPAVAILTRSLRADLGVMISASHNPFQDNGLKFFGPDGYKLSDDAEFAIEDLFEKGLDNYRAKPSSLGRAKRLDDALGRYIEFSKSTFPKHLRLEGLKIVIDCANGAAYKVAPAILWELGADVIPMGVHPDGFNINKKCGSLSTQTMAEAVVAHGADIGIALDGDADRVVLCDENGQIIDGDQVMALIGSHWNRRGQLNGKAVVATVMSNLGLEHFLKKQGIGFYRTAVGDRYVLEKMRELNINLGGEQSGHIVMTDFTTTGDGLIAALQVLAAIIEAKRPASEVLNLFKPYPQILKNITIMKNKTTQILNDERVIKIIENGEKRLADRGRILIRPSGTEPLIRVMAEGDDETMIREVVDEIVSIITHVRE